jgi:hypothetical protein
MRSVGDGAGIDLMTDTHPPKSLYIEVRCVQVRNGAILIYCFIVVQTECVNDTLFASKEKYVVGNVLV